MQNKLYPEMEQYYNRKKFLTDITITDELRNFLNLKRNKKYTCLDVDWHTIFTILNTESNNDETSFVASKNNRRIIYDRTNEKIMHGNLQKYEMHSMSFT